MLTNITVQYQVNKGLPAFFLSKADVVAITNMGYADAEEYMAAAYPDSSDETITRVVIEANKCLTDLRHCNSDDRCVASDQIETVDFTLDHVDTVVMRSMLYRYPSGGNIGVPKTKIDAIEYLRVKYGMGYEHAKDLMDAIDARSHELS